MSSANPSCHTKHVESSHWLPDENLSPSFRRPLDTLEKLLSFYKAHLDESAVRVASNGSKVQRIIELMLGEGFLFQRASVNHIERINDQIQKEVALGFLCPPQKHRLDQ